MLDGSAYMILSIFSLVLLMVCATLAIEVGAACYPKNSKGNAFRARECENLAVLIPAHNESASIKQTVKSLMKQLAPEDRLLVVADNCTDDTSIIAREHGAEILERVDEERRGKGYALQYGIDHLRKNPPSIVIVVDADCEMGPNSIDILCFSVSENHRPVQALYLMIVDEVAPLKQRISAFAFKMRNLVRFEGLRILGFGCPLAGTGMAFPWSVIERAQIGNSNVVEDMKLGIDLAVDGYPALFEPRALVTSKFPESCSGQTAQRRRWEHGHIQTIFSDVPRFIWQSFRQCRLDLLMMAADLLVPPLSLLAIMTTATLFLASILFIFSVVGSFPAIVAMLSFVILCVSVIGAWYSYGRSLLTFGDLFRIPAYVISKFSIYAQFLYNRERVWRRALRDNEINK